MEGSGRGLILRYYPVTCLEGLRETTQSLSRNTRSPGQDLNPGPPEYEAECQCGILLDSVPDLLANLMSYSLRPRSLRGIRILRIDFKCL
jgi:hypothetical protein